MFNFGIVTALILSYFYFNFAEADCFKFLLYHTQRCSNTNLLYSRVVPGGSGFGSQFHYYYVDSLKRAILSNKRLVYVYDNSSDWEANCEGNYSTNHKNMNAY